MPENHASPDGTAVLRWTNVFAIVISCSVIASSTAWGQLAITEVMSNAETSTVGGDDFWELTNFGAEPIDLLSFWFRDGTGFTGAVNLGDLWAATRSDWPPWIDPGESIVFVRSRIDWITTPADFRSWWGHARLPTDLKIVFYGGFGFDSMQDAVNLWQMTDEGAELIHRVELFESPIGRTFTYHPTTGALDGFSRADEAGAFVAATTGDVGSPGRHMGRVALRVITDPVDAEVDGGAPVSFTVRAQGLPVPQYQWRFNGEPIPGARADTLTLPAAMISDAGFYSVELSNGVGRLITPSATLKVNTRPSCARVVHPPSDIEVTPGHTAIFRVETRGYPLPAFQWRFNGEDIPGATEDTYSVTCIDESCVGRYTVEVSNPLCRTNVSAQLRVIPEDNLIVTEVMASPIPEASLGHNTWWELTNAGTNRVNLLGYRWDDKPPSFEGALPVTSDVILLPGQSAIFVSGMTPETFRRWWGEENLPHGLAIIPHHGNGMSPFGDLIKVWNPSARTDNESLLDLSFVNLEAGVSFWFDPVEPACGFGCLSVAGERGAFRAAESDDIGSPGWTSNAQRVVRPRVLSIRREASGIILTWRTQPGRTYELRHRDSLGGADWSRVVRLQATGESLTATDASPRSAFQRFYQVILIP